MKNTPLSKIRKKPISYFRNLGTVRKGRRKKSTIEYIVRRSYEALPRNLREYIEDPEQAIQALTNMISHSNDINPYEALKQSAKYTRMKSGDNTKQFIWNRFRTETPTLYAKFNSYMYRQGLSARNYFMENVTTSQEGSWIEAYCELPAGAKVSYSMLEINYDFSGHEFNAYLY